MAIAAIQSAVMKDRSATAPVGSPNEVLESVQSVARGERGAAFLINPLSVAEVQSVVAAGDVLPPKSTNFFPKVIAGLTIHAFGDSERS